MIALTVALFAAMGHLGLGFDKSALLSKLTAGYNVLIVSVKFVFVPASLYITNLGGRHDHRRKGLVVI